MLRLIEIQKNPRHVVLQIRPTEPEGHAPLLGEITMDRVEWEATLAQAERMSRAAHQLADFPEDERIYGLVLLERRAD